MVSITFTGDIAFSGYYKEKYKDSNLIHSEIVHFLKSSDYVVANIECPITNSRIQSQRMINHYMEPDVMPFLKNMNINVWNLANNHILDCGKEGLDDTINYSKNEHVLSIGANVNKKEAAVPLILGNDIKIGLISLIDTWRWMQAENDKCGSILCSDYDTIKEQIKELNSQKVNHIVAVIHNGNEFSTLPTKSIREKFHKLLELGVDIIVGHHPHVVQNYERVGKKIIFYSLGNFIFDTDFQRLQKNTDKGVILKINFQKNGYDFEYINTFIDRKNEHILNDENENPIFTNLSDEDYFLLYPLAIKKYLDSNKISEKYFNLNSNKITRIKKCIGKLKNKSTLYRFLYYLQYWRLYKNKKVVNYIKES